MTELFVDTGAFLGRHIKRDQHHAVARAAWKTVEKRRDRCYTSSFVLDEVFTLLGRRCGYSFAAERARQLLMSRALVILRPEAEDELRALEWFKSFAEHEVSFTDCVSFALMKRHRLSRAFGFDRHFRDAGFEVWPD